MNVKRTTSMQMNILVTFMEENISVATGTAEGASYKNLKQDKWLKLEKALNEFGPPFRDVKGWRKVWTDLIHETRKKIRGDRTTRGGSGRSVKLTHLQNRVQDLLELGGQSLAGSSRTLGFHQDDSTHSSQNCPSTGRSPGFSTCDEVSYNENDETEVIQEEYEIIEENDADDTRPEYRRSNPTETKTSLLNTFTQRFDSTVSLQEEQMSLMKDMKKSVEDSFKDLINIQKETQEISLQRHDLECERLKVEKERLEIEKETLKTFQNIQETIRKVFEK